jgi:hypothetical protein
MIPIFPSLLLGEVWITLWGQRSRTAGPTILPREILSRTPKERCGYVLDWAWAAAYPRGFEQSSGNNTAPLRMASPLAPGSRA